MKNQWGARQWDNAQFIQIDNRAWQRHGTSQSWHSKRPLPLALATPISLSAYAYKRSGQFYAGQFFLVENISSPILPSPVLSSPILPTPAGMPSHPLQQDPIRQEYRPAGSSRNTVRQDCIRQEYHPIQHEPVRQDPIRQEPALKLHHPAGFCRILQDFARFLSESTPSYGRNTDPYRGPGRYSEDTISWDSEPFLEQPCRKRQSPQGYLETGNRRPHKRIFLGVRNTFVYLKLPT